MCVRRIPGLHACSHVLSDLRPVFRSADVPVCYRWASSPGGSRGRMWTNALTEVLLRFVPPWSVRRTRCRMVETLIRGAKPHLAPNSHILPHESPCGDARL